MCYKQEVDKRMIPFKDDTDTNAKIDKAAKWLTGDFKVGLMLYGSVGSGKSTLGRAISNLIGILYDSSKFQERKTVRRISSLEVAKSISDNPDLFNRLKNDELLFIDDIGTEPASVKSWGNEFSPVVELIYSRYDKQLFTIATSNLGENDLEQRYGLRIYDRIQEMFERVSYHNESYRR